MPINDNWLADNFTLEIIRAKVAANKANATSDQPRECSGEVQRSAEHGGPLGPSIFSETWTTPSHAAMAESW
jgi:hypothetical protein